ncbi:hypothetical protein [Rhodopirellula bahusiensis]
MIGPVFTVNGRGPFGGSVVIGADRIYLVATTNPITLTSLFTGRLFQGWRVQPCQDTGLFPIELSELEPSVVETSSWPASDSEALVRMLHKSGHLEIQYNLLKPAYKWTITCDNDSVAICSHLPRQKVSQLLADYQWISAA